MKFDNALGQAKKIKWMQIGKWVTPYLMDSMASKAVATPFLSPLKYKGILNSYLIIDGEYHWDREDYEDRLRYLRQSYHEKGSNFLLDFYRFSQRKTQETLKKINSLNLETLPLNSLSDKRIAKVFKEWIELPHPLMYLDGIFIALDEVIEKTVYEDLSKLLGKKADHKLLLAELFPPKSLAFVIQEEDDLLVIAQEVTRHKVLLEKLLSNPAKNALNIINQHSLGIARQIKNHTKKYAWLSVADWLGPLFTTEYFVERIIKAIKDDPGATLKKRQMEREQREQDIAGRLKEIKAPKKFIDMWGAIRDLLDLKLREYDVVSIAGYKARKMLALIGQRIGGLTYEEVMQLTFDEIENLLITKQKVDKSLIKDRLSHRALLRLGTKTWFLKGEEVVELKNKLFPKQTKIADKVIKGSPSYAGKISGKVRIIPTIVDLSSMKDGEILVCPMTNTDYMPAIRKAKGIVTDHGGILCHAAIISRELKIPCIVGTKIATHVLKDGDLVEVDANRGVVRVIKNN